MRPKFKEGDSVRFTGGTYVIQDVGKRIEYDMNGRIGTIKSVSKELSAPYPIMRVTFDIVYSYRVEVEIEGVKRQVYAKESELELGRIATPFTSMLASADRIVRNARLNSILDKTYKDLESYLSKVKTEVDNAIVGVVWENGRLVVKNNQDYATMPKKDEEKKPESKMSKDRCIKLLERFRAEREKLERGRKFELRLRNSVVDEALERAIELLKSENL